MVHAIVKSTRAVSQRSLAQLRESFLSLARAILNQLCADKRRSALLPFIEELGQIPESPSLRTKMLASISVSSALEKSEISARREMPASLP